MTSRVNDFVIKVANVTVEDSRKVECSRARMARRNCHHARDGARKNDTTTAPLESLAAK
jgi:hypothetical protein